MKLTLNKWQGRTAATAAFALALAVPIGCSSDSSDEAEPAQPVAADETNADVGPTTVEVTLVDYGFEGLPDEVPAGTKLTVVNASDIEVHELVAILLPDGEERSAQELLALPEDEQTALLAGRAPATVLLAEPGGAPMIPAVGDGTLIEPGRYLITCFIPVGADPAEFMAAAAESQGGPPQVDGGPPHVTQGMYAELRVT
ncbi:hypothetical protein [Rhabdothermincola salaria]|uniref:hypothetical protein n=1 Tax=Rhabdothermincola salaria TaxID=2903142 RepID=UPI001E5DD8B1|nr:hypothetical protein [Rhabdothermincola salaria]MCD9625182.1 hypothetical protein [Rhabdothermincola salaria]